MKELNYKIDSLANEQNIYAITKSAVEGAISGTTTEASEEQIKKLGEFLGRELDKAIKNIDTKKPGKNFSNGVTANLLNDEVEESLKNLVSNAIESANGDVSRAIADIEINLSKSLNKIFSNLNGNIDGLQENLANTLSDNLRDSLSFFLTEAIANIEFQELSSHISTELLSSELRDTLSQIVVDIKKEIGREDGTFSNVKEYIFSALLLGFLLGMLLIRYYFMRKSTLEVQMAKDMSDTFDEILANNPELKDNIVSTLRKKESLKSIQKNIIQKPKKT